MNKDKTAGHLSRVIWDEEDLQVQTEFRTRPSPRITTIMVVNGKVISQVEKKWIIFGNQAEQQVRISKYHEGLTRAISQLRDKSWIKLSDLSKLAEKLVTTALRLSGSVASEALSLLPGASWAALVGGKGEILQTCPSNDFVFSWCNSSTGLMNSSLGLTHLFEAGTIEDISLKTSDGYVLIVPRGNCLLLAGVDMDSLATAREILKRLAVGNNK